MNAPYLRGFYPRATVDPEEICVSPSSYAPSTTERTRTSSKANRATRTRPMRDQRTGFPLPGGVMPTPPPDEGCPPIMPDHRSSR